jgi:hypothetical protein
MPIPYEVFLGGLAVATLSGGAVGGSVTYLLARRLFSFEFFYKGKESALNEMRLERIPSSAQKGVFRKKYYLVIQERLLFKSLPISPWWEHRLQVSEMLDKDEINAVAKALTSVADKLLEFADLKKMALKAIGERKK